MARRPITWKILFALPLAWAVICAPIASAQKTNESAPPLKADQLMGMKLEDLDGERDGIVRNVVIDTTSGQLEYVVVASGGFMGVRSTLKLVPPQALSAATTKRETLAIRLTTEQWRHAPVFKPSELASLANSDRAREIARFFGLPEREIAGQTTGKLPDKPRGTFKFASDLIGTRVVNLKHEKIGEVTDMLVGLGRPRPALAIISTGRLFRRERQYAVPLPVLSKTAGGSEWILNVDTAALLKAPPFTEQAWQLSAASDKLQICRYSNNEE